jgi:hypothetical protein
MAHLPTVRPAHHAGQLAALQGAHGVVVNPDPGDPHLAIAVSDPDAILAVQLKVVVRYLDVLGGLEHDARDRTAPVAVAVMVDGVVVERAAPTRFVLDAGLAVVVDVVAGGNDGVCEPVAPEAK